jgi:tetratricopeptide (TPR) repeat protein
MADDAERIRTALSLYREGELSRAQMLLETLDPDELDPALRVEALYLLGLVYVKRGDAMDASQCFLKCTRLDKKFFPAFDAWGNLLMNLGDTHGAADKYRRALAVAGPELAAHALFNYGQALMRAGLFMRALRKFRECYQNSASPDAAYMAGVCFLEMGRAQGARKWMQNALDAEPNSARNLTGMGNALALDGNDEDAIAHFQLAIDNDPSCADAHYNWALALARRNEYAKAVRRCKLGLRAQADGYELLTHQAYCLRQMGAYDAAMQAARRMRQIVAASSRHERKASFLDTISANEAACLRALGRAHQARVKLIEHLRAARDASPRCVAELRHQNGRRIRSAQRVEISVSVTPADDGHWSAGRPYSRTYWVLAAGVKEARRIVRELEPPDAEVRFAGHRIQEALPHADQGVIERSLAVLD